jgi:hypothetical protein
LAGGDDGYCLFGFGDQADSGGENLGIIADDFEPIKFCKEFR